MRDTIAKIDTFLVPGEERPEAWCRRKPYVFVRVETSAGVVGWGEGYTLNFREQSLIALIDGLAEQFKGSDAVSMRAVAQRAYHGFGEQRAGIDVFCAAAYALLLYNFIALLYSVNIVTSAIDCWENPKKVVDRQIKNKRCFL